MYMTERLGAWQVGDDPERGKIEFKLFLPDRARDERQYAATSQDQFGSEIPDYGDPKIASIQVAGDFQHLIDQQDWDFEAAPLMEKQAHPKGWIWRCQTDRELPAGFYQYKYFVTFQNGETRKVGDPCTRYGGSDHQNSALVIGGTDPRALPLAGGRKPLRDLVVYELMIDDFTDEYRSARAPIDAVRDRLPYLARELGVNAILFMPWTAWPGERFNWGYTPYQYFSVEYRYANALDQPAEKLSWLVNLITDCHSLGIHVIMDGVFNHVGDVGAADGVAEGFPYRWLYQNVEACPYVGRFGGVFPGLTDLDFHNECTQEFIRDVCLYWIDHFNIDGIRFDNTPNFLVANERRGLPRLLDDIRNHLAAQGEDNFSLTLEHLSSDAAAVANSTGAASYWNNELYQRGFDYLWSGRIDSRIMRALDSHAGLDPDKVATVYLSNHDHSHVTWQAGAAENAGGLRWYRTQPYAIALLTSPGAVLIQNGQEFAEDHWIMEDDQGTGRRVRPRPLRWDFVGDRVGSTMMKLYAKLIALRRTHPALCSNNFYPDRWETWQSQFNPAGYGVDVAKQVVIYHRWAHADDGALERFIIALNFSNDDQIVDIPFSDDGVWQDVLNDRADSVTGCRLHDQRLPSNWGRIYWQRT